MSGFVLHPEAFADLDEVWEHIATNNIEAADRIREEIFDAFHDLVPFPHQGYRRPDLTTRPLRFTSRRDYLIAYAPDEKPLIIIAVLHGRRNPDTFGAILRARQ